MRSLAALTLLLAASIHAHAAPPPTAGVTAALATIIAGYGNIPKAMKPPRFAITNDDVAESPGDWGGLLVPTRAPSGTLRAPLAGVSADGTGGWVATDIAVARCQRGANPNDSSGDSSYFEDENCMWEQPGAFARGALVVTRVGEAWQPVAWHLYGVAPRYVGPAPLTALTAKLEPGAKDAAALFEASVGDPRALIKTLSPRKDVVLFGSAKAERFVGAAQIGATLTRWNLGFKPRGATVAGTAGPSVAWVAANLEATSLGKTKGKPSLYRALFVYERVADAWLLVQASFSDVAAP
jgi:hypothetical protein